MKGVDITVEQVTRAYGDFKALDDVSVTIEKGEFFSLLGPSGCGKTTLLRIIAGFDYPDTGSVAFDGKDVLSVPPERRQSNTIFQTYALFPHLSVYENVAFPLRLKRVAKETIDKKVKEYIHLVQLEEHLYKKPSQLSGGQKQRVAIARALINEPSVLLLDEPLSALDAKLRQNLLIELDHIHDQVGITFIYVTHDQSEALSVSDRVAVMNKGKILQIGSPYEIYEAPATRFVATFIGETNIFGCTILSCEPYGDEYLLHVDVPELGTTILVTDWDPLPVGAKMDFTVRPEKVRITRAIPKNLKSEVNMLKGVVDEPVYSGFQSKFYVKLDESESIMKVYKQHTAFLDDGPDIEWLDEVYVSWHADDGYLVKDTSQ
ncbi:MAG TPA: ABC transporter ATP-binding protein [Sphaerochaeta sp.]|nr:ABC transporter ATP-binding protein [Sphaerochaeta sp.]